MGLKFLVMPESLINQADVAIIYPQNRDILWFLVADFRFSHESDSRLDLLPKDLYPMVLTYLNQQRPEITGAFNVMHRNFLFNPSYLAGLHLENLILGINRDRIDPDRINAVFQIIRKDDDKRALRAALLGDRYHLSLVYLSR